MKFLNKYISLTVSVFLVVLFFASSVFSIDFKEDAKSYRDLGLQAQNSGDVELAMTYYQKSVELDPYYATAYNDLGVVYEAKGMYDRAESAYSKAIETDPKCLSSYSNLASIYERQGDYEKAAYYLKLRIKLGDPSDVWTQNAKDRLYKIAEIVPSIKKEFVDQETMDLTLDLIKQKQLKDVGNKPPLKTMLAKAKEYYRMGEYTPAFKELVKVIEVDPYNQEAQDLMKATQRRILM